jgi:hypothetical protein
MVSSKYGSLWNRDELILALYLYCQIPFAKTKANNPEVIKLATLLDRTPASVARKLGNFGAFDPLLAEQCITGLAHGGKADRLVWDEFRHRWEALVEESNRLLTILAAPPSSIESLEKDSLAEDEEIIARPSGPSERRASVSVRLFQSFFRRTVLASYSSSCCVCGLDLRPLLVASHIVPWSVDESARTEPENGLCLCAIHDRAFDRGLITVSEKLEVAVASMVISSKQEFVRAAFVNFHSQPLRMPKRFAPRQQFLDWHRRHIFERNLSR